MGCNPALAATVAAQWVAVMGCCWDSLEAGCCSGRLPLGRQQTPASGLYNGKGQQAAFSRAGQCVMPLLNSTLLHKGTTTTSFFK